MAGLQARLQPIPTPAGTEFPGNPDALHAMIAAYMKIVGLEDFNGVNYGAMEPGENFRDKPWFKTDASGNAIGWFTWNGFEWVMIPTRNESGSTRPATGSLGQQFWDSEISVMLVWNGNGWVTLAGSPGDTKEVKAPTLDEALKRNPGWIQDGDSIGRVVSGADKDAVVSATNPNVPFYGNAYGTDDVIFDASSIPTHRHFCVSPTLATTGENPPNKANPYLAWVDNRPSTSRQYQLLGTFSPPTVAVSSAPINDAGEEFEATQPVSLIQKTIAYWRIVKE